MVHRGRFVMISLFFSGAYDGGGTKHVHPQLSILLAPVLIVASVSLYIVETNRIIVYKTWCDA